MSEAKGPYTVQVFGDGFAVVSPTSKMVYWSAFRGDCDRQCLYFNESAAYALTAQADRILNLENACRNAASQLELLEASLFAKVPPSHIAYISKEAASQCAGSIAKTLRDVIQKAAT